MTHPRKRFGQHFLHDQNIIHRIIDAIAPSPQDICVEIGPGKGVLTRHLINRCQHLTVIEIDRDLIPVLQRKYANNPNFQLIEADVLKVNFSELAQSLGQQPIRIVGNLPYNISTPLLFHLCQHKNIISDMIFMLQKEVVERMAAQPGSKTYGRLSVMTQFYCQVSSLFNVSPEAFSPPPKVDSSIVKLIPYQQPHYPDCNETDFADIVRAAFAHRRKTLANCLKGILTSDQITTAGINPTERAENLSVADFVKLTQCLK